jgi:serine/threonine protein kinase
MALTQGSRLGPYEIIAPLGAGGMGEVYRARDSKLGRDVAIKVLPAALPKTPRAWRASNARPMPRSIIPTSRLSMESSRRDCDGAG